ncbi:MAG: NAD(P)H-hydrate dehydratase [Nitrososphaeria archaeon]
MAIEITEEVIRSIYPPRKSDSHKGQNGRVLVVGGSWMYHGAPYIASLAALISGVDLVYTAVPKPLVNPIRSMNPNLIVIPLPDFRLTRGSARRLIRLMPEVDVVLIGNGLGKGNEEGIIELIKESPVKRLVLDADALTAEVVKAAGERSTIVTPHEGEFKRISNIDLSGKDLDYKVESAEKYSKENGVTVLLKGVVDIITDGETTYLNYTGNAGMTIGGTGDALAGLTSGLFSKGLKGVDAGAIAAYVNGAAGDLALKERGLHFTATDVISYYPVIMKKFDVII